MYDVLIRNGMVFDGSQSDPEQLDVAVADGRVVSMGLGLGEATRVIDATGKYVGPGFIDPHTHSDMSLLVEPDGDSKLRQGVTTEVVGNCGESPAPAYGLWAEELQLNRFATAGIEVTWSSFGEYLSHLAQLKPIVNLVPLVGHGAVRASVIGIDDRAPDTCELDRMKDLTRAAMSEGAWGISTGLIYPPGVYSQTEELVELARVVAGFGGIYATHVRGEGRCVIAAVNEALEIGQRAQIPVQVSHLKVSGFRTWKLIDELMGIVERSRNAGAPVRFDQYPYAASATCLQAVLPEWTYVGGSDACSHRLADPAARERLRGQMQDTPAEFWDYAGTEDWDGVLITNYPTEPQYQGKSVGEVARLLGKDPLDTLLDILVGGRCVADCVLFDQHEPNVKCIMQHDLVMVGSDGYSVKAQGYMGKRAMHPRSYGTFPRVLGRYARDGATLTWPQAIHKMTGMAAGAIGLTDRGCLCPGARGDIVVFTPDTVLDRATFTEPHQYPIGIDYVLVNGQVAVADGRTTGVRAGAVLAPRR